MTAQILPGLNHSLTHLIRGKMEKDEQFCWLTEMFHRLTAAIHLGIPAVIQVDLTKYSEGNSPN